MITDFIIDLGIIEKYHLTTNELFVIKLLLVLQDEDNQTPLHRFLSLPEEVRGDLREIIISLQNKGVILKSYKVPNKGDSFDPYGVEFNKIFLKNFYKSSFEMGQELFDTYPMFGHINGSVVPLRNVSKHFNSLEDFFVYYGKAIGHNPEKHSEIIELLEWVKENTEYLQMSIASFVISRQWNELKALKDGEIANVNYEAIKMI